MEQKSNLEELSNEQIIGSIYEMFGKKTQPLDIKHIGNYGIVSSGQKSFDGVVKKVLRKTLEDHATADDIARKVPASEIIDRDFQGMDGELFDQVSDWSRLSIVIPDYKSAPQVTRFLLSNFGGNLSIHEREEYKAIHLHSNYKNVNFEFQIHTEGGLELKQATDICYHKFNNSNIESNSINQAEREMTERKVKQYTKVIYDRSNFDQYLPDVKKVEEEYKKNPTHKPTEKLSNLCLYYAKAYKVQKELEQKIAKFLEQINQQEKIQGSEK